MYIDLLSFCIAYIYYPYIFVKVFFFVKAEFNDTNIIE